MKVKHLIIIGVLIFIIMLFVIIKVNSNNNNTTSEESNETVSVQETKEQQTVEGKNKINLTQDQFKNSLEKTENGIKITDVKLNSNANNIINVSLKAENTNEEERIVNIRVTYHNQEGNQIGENGFAIGYLNKGETKDIDSTCYIEKADVSEIKLEVTADEIVIDEGKQDPTGSSGEDTTSSDTIN